MRIYPVVGACIALTLVAHDAAGAETNTYTGAGLFNDPAVTFPTTTAQLGPHVTGVWAGR